MAKLIGVGCDKCNNDIAYAMREMGKRIGYMGVYEFARLPDPKPYIAIDGQDMRKMEAFAVTLGSDGWLLRNNLDPKNRNLVYNVDHRSTGKHSHAHLCECGSNEVCVELWEGNVTLEGLAAS